MDTTKRNIIVQEIIDLDPSLKPHEAHVRAIVEEMDAERPLVPVDPAFVTGLRARLMLAPRPVRSPFMSMSAWAFRLAPIGAVALLFLMLMPPSYQTGQYEFPDASSDPRIIDIYTGSDVGRYSRTQSPGMMQYKIGGGGDATYMATEADSTMSYRGADFDMSEDTTMSDEEVPGWTPVEQNPYMPPVDGTGNYMGDMSIAEMSLEPVDESLSGTYYPSSETSLYLTVSPQQAGTVLYIEKVVNPLQGFVAIYENSGTTYHVGESSIVGPGTTYNVPIELERPAPSGATYYARFFTDNGDGLLHDIFDSIEVDQNGMIRTTPIPIK
jgi:hypothetical protein